MATLTATELAVLLAVVAGVFTLLGAGVSVLGEARQAAREARREDRKDRRETRRDVLLRAARVLVDLETRLGTWVVTDRALREVAGPEPTPGSAARSAARDAARESALAIVIDGPELKDVQVFGTDGLRASTALLRHLVVKGDRRVSAPDLFLQDGDDPDDPYEQLREAFVLAGQMLDVIRREANLAD